MVRVRNAIGLIENKRKGVGKRRALCLSIFQLYDYFSVKGVRGLETRGSIGVAWSGVEYIHPRLP